MTPERWLKLKPLIHQALARPTTERAAFVQAACGQDESLQREALAFLAEEETTVRQAPLAGLFEPADTHDYKGLAINRYHLLEELGRGGMGVVFLAEEQSSQKRVAIKFMRAGLDGKDKVVRFHYERFILSELDHPNIAKILDGGTTHDGLHYLVMDFIPGLPISGYCDTHRLAIPARIELFDKVVLALDFAHQRGVVHRDLKPSNILVTPAGEPILLDFGIAQMTDPLSIAYAASDIVTRGQMTPEYAAPEQARGETPTVQTDIYSLGVVLYELLTGYRPYALDADAPETWAPTLSEVMPRQPSDYWSQAHLDMYSQEIWGPLADRRATQPDKLRRTLKKCDDLLLKTLEKHPDDRHPDCETLHQDLLSVIEALASDSFIVRLADWLKKDVLP